MIIGYISNVETYMNYKNSTYLLYKTKSENDSFTIRNCLIENIDVKSNQPLLTASKISLK